LNSIHFSSVLQPSDNDVKQLRAAHAAEIFRSNFYEYRKDSTSISCLDLDQLIMSSRVRPSALVCPFEYAGRAFGTISRYSPTLVSDAILGVVDEAAIQIYNDSIREMQGLQSSDIKEALKFHREIKSSVPITDEDTVSNIFGKKEFIATGLRTILNISKIL